MGEKINDLGITYRLFTEDDFTDVATLYTHIWTNNVELPDDKLPQENRNGASQCLKSLHRKLAAMRAFILQRCTKARVLRMGSFADTIWKFALEDGTRCGHFGSIPAGRGAEARGGADLPGRSLSGHLRSGGGTGGASLQCAGVARRRGALCLRRERAHAGAASGVGAGRCPVSGERGEMVRRSREDRRLRIFRGRASRRRMAEKTGLPPLKAA